MKIDVSEILESSGETMAFEKSQAYEGTDEIYKSICGPVTVKGVATSVDQGQIYVQANAAGKIKLHCSRCLSPFFLDFDLNFEARFVEEVKPEDDEESDIEVRDLDGVYCELDDLISNEVRLTVPMKPLCNAECKGLCQICGTNLNEGSCQCAKTVEGPTSFGAKLLEALKEGSNYNGSSKKAKI